MNNYATVPVIPIQSLTIVRTIVEIKPCRLANLTSSKPPGVRCRAYGFFSFLGIFYCVPSLWRHKRRHQGELGVVAAAVLTRELSPVVKTVHLATLLQRVNCHHDQNQKRSGRYANGYSDRHSGLIRFWFWMLNVWVLVGLFFGRVIFFVCDFQTFCLLVFKSWLS